VKNWIFSHRNHLPIPFIILILSGYVLTREKHFYILLEIMGWASIIAGEALRVWSVGYAGASTRSMRLKAEKLVIGGPYAVIRNPIYLGNFFIGLGFCFIAGLWWVFPLYLVYFAVQYSAIISLEEEFLLKKFGEDYRAYCTRVPRYIPGYKSLFQRAEDISERTFQISSLSGEYWTVIGILAMGALLELLR